MSVEQQIGQVKALLGMKEEPDVELDEYAVIAWQEDAEADNMSGDRWKTIFVFRHGNRQTHQYSAAMVKLLYNKGIPYYDATLGLPKPLSNYSNIELAEAKTGLLQTFYHGISLGRA